MSNNEPLIGGNGDGQQRDKVVAKIVAQILITKDGGVIVKSPMVEEAPAFLIEILGKAVAGVATKIMQKEERRIISSPGLMNRVANTLGLKAFLRRKHA